MVHSNETIPATESLQKVEGDFVLSPEELLSGLYKKIAYYNTVKWYAKNYDEINESFNKIVDYDFEGGGYDKFNMEYAYLYMSKFENTGYFSENYIKNLEYKFKDIKKIGGK